MKVIRKERFDVYRWEGENHQDFNEFVNSIKDKRGISFYYDDIPNRVRMAFSDPRPLGARSMGQGNYMIVPKHGAIWVVSEKEFKEQYEVIE